MVVIFQMICFENADQISSVSVQKAVNPNPVSDKKKSWFMIVGKKCQFKLVDMKKCQLE